MSRWQRFLMDSIGNIEGIELLRKWIRDMLTEGRRPEKILVLYGGPGSGKSVLTEIIIALAGHGNTATMLPSADTFGAIHLKNKKLLALKELRAILKNNAANLKSLHSDTLIGQRPYCSEMERFTPGFGILVVQHDVLEHLEASLRARLFLLKMYLPEWSDRHLLGNLLSGLESIRAWALA